MIFTFIVLIFCTSILVFFSQEWVGMVKKLLAIRGMALLLPLILATTLILYYETVVIQSLYIIQLLMNALIGLLAAIIPLGSYALGLAKIIVLMICSALPVAIIHQWKKKRNFIGMKHPYFTCGLLWIFFAFLLLEQLPYLI